MRDLLDPDVFAASLPELDPDDVVTIAEELEPEQLYEVLSALPDQERFWLNRARPFPKICRPHDAREMVVVPPFWTVGQTIDFLRSSDLDREEFYLIMVTDVSGHPVGEEAE